MSAAQSSSASRGSGLALYRKYRSANFADVIGQDHVTRPLSLALDSGRVNHAYLFSGPRGCGKTSSARILARSLNCAKGPTSTPCGACDSCVELAPNGVGSIDVIEIDAASHNGVDDARELRERAWYAPVRDHYKVYIIDEAHMVTTAAFNALLKLVEEPPEFLIFVFATTEPDKVLQTIRSRTHHYPFRLVPPSLLRGHLERICLQEGVAIEPAVLPLITRAGGGSVRDSLSILDQLFAGAGEEGVTYRDAVALLGVTDSALLDTMVDALAAGDAGGVYGAVNQLVEAGHDPRRFAADLLDHLRDLLIMQAVPGAVESGLLDYPADAAARMNHQISRIGPAGLTRYGEVVHQALVDMRGTTSPRLVLELVCARMLLPDASADAAAVLQRLEQLERRETMSPARRQSAAPTSAGPSGEPPPAASSGRTTEPAPAPAPDPAPSAAQAQDQPVTRQPAHPPTQPGSTDDIDRAALQSLWQDSIMDMIKRRSQRTRALLLEAQISEVQGNRLTLALPSAPLARLAGEESNVAIVRECLTEAVGGSWVVDVVARVPDGQQPHRSTVADDPSTAGSRPPQRPGRAAADDPRDEPDYDPQRPVPRSPARDPEEAAVGLLRAELGARPVE